MAYSELNVSTRNIDGLSAKALRRQGLMPAVVYGYHKETQSLTVNLKEWRNLLNDISSQSLISLVIDGDTAQQKTVMIKDLQRHPVSQKFVHADFYEVDMKKEIVVSIPVHTSGTSKGEEEGGTLQIIRRELDVRCLPANIPESIEIDVSNLEIGDAIHVEELETEEGVELVYDINFTVISVAAPTLEEEPEEEEEGLEGEEGEAAEDEEAGDEEGGEGSEE
ncbi:MAG: 50S ribosomal protein L25 [Thermodesulfobacteriota bacterium]|nr:50S ribosomal protein L25 [Thermodesulfobacteriota bacterium]